jgi:S1-C subfamily serine protease
MKILAALLLSLSLVVPVAADDWSPLIDRVLKSVVYIESEDALCTGFVIDTKRKFVMTAAHCDGPQIFADRVVAEVIAKDTKKDLLVLEVRNLDPLRPALKLAAGDPKIGQEVLSVGYGMALERPFFRKAMVSDTAVQIPEAGIGGPYIGLDSAFVGGQSGGPVVNSSGEVVLIVQMASNTIGIGVGADIIRDRMGRFFEFK